MKKWEISLLFGAAVMLVWGAVEPGSLMHWWGVAFSPLCGSMNYAQLGGGDVVVRSKIWESFASPVFIPPCRCRIIVV